MFGYISCRISYATSKYIPKGTNCLKTLCPKISNFHHKRTAVNKQWKETISQHGVDSNIITDRTAVNKQWKETISQHGVDSNIVADRTAVNKQWKETISQHDEN